MQRTTTRSITKQQKTLNDLGLAYKDAKKSKQLAYQSALIEAGESDQTNYWRAFRDVWRYSNSIGKAPFLIVALAKEILGVNNLNPLSK